MVVYLITNRDNGKMYIGKTERTFAERWKAHCFDALHNKSDTYFHRSIRKHRPYSFTYKILAEVKSRMELDEAEIHFIALYETHNPEFGYNGSLGGTGGIMTAESRKRLSESLKGRKHKPTSEETKEKIRIANTGRKKTQEEIEKMRETRKRNGKKLSEETRAKMSLAKKGGVLSEEHKRKIGLASIGRKDSEETTLKKIASGKLRKHTEETKQKLSEVRLKYWKKIHEINEQPHEQRKRRELICV